jgi:hypothetical protein
VAKGVKLEAGESALRVFGLFPQNAGSFGDYLRVLFLEAGRLDVPGPGRSRESRACFYEKRIAPREFRVTRLAPDGIPAAVWGEPRL